MAATEVTTISQGVTRNECFWGYVLKGKQDALIASGLVKKGWFIKPGQLDEKGRICRSKKLVVNGRTIHTTIPANGAATVRVHFTEAERNAHEEQQRAGRARQQPRSQCQEHEPKSVNDFREHMTNVTRLLTYHIHTLAGWKAENVPFRYNDEALNEMRNHIAEIWITIQDGKIIKLRDPIDLERMGAVSAAESDSVFQRFLGRLDLGQRPAA